MDILIFLCRRLRQRWQIWLLLIMSVTVSAGLLASGPLLVDAVMRFALPYKLQTAEPLDSGLRLTAYDKPDVAAYQALDSQLRGFILDNLGAHDARVIASAGSNWLYPWYLEQLVKDQRIQVRFMQAFQSHANLTEGDWPDPAQQAEMVNEGVVYTAIPQALAQAFDLQVGDRLPLSRTEYENAPTSWLFVTGIVEPHDALESYWFGSYSPLAVQSGPRFVAQYNIIVEETSFFLLQNTFYPGARAELNWNVFLDPQTVQVDNASMLVEKLASLRGSLVGMVPAVSMLTHIEELLNDFVSQARVVQVTLFVVIIEILFLALYFLNMAAGLAAQQVESEFASLASRGASFGQVFKIQAVEAGLLGLAGLLAGPPLAWLAVWALGRFGPFASLGQADWMPHLPGTAWLAAGIGALASALFLLAPVYPLVQRSVVTHARRITRPEAKAWWQRAYLDVFAVLAAALLAWRMRAYGGVAASGQVDWLLLLAPLALLVSAAILLLRLFPLLMQALAWQASRGRGITSALAFWFNARSPTQVVRLVLLLALTMALGMLSTGLETTLEKVERERALYAAGSDLRIRLGSTFSPLDISSLPGVEATSRVWRGTGSADILNRRASPVVEMLAIEPYSFASVTRYRSDYANQPVGELLGGLVVDTSNQASLLLPLPGEPAKFGVWVRDQKSRYSETSLVDHIYLQAKLQTTNAETFLVDLQLAPVEGRSSEDLIPDEEWRYFEAELPSLPASSYPLALHSIWLNPRLHAQDFFSYIQLYLDDFSVTDRPTGTLTIADDFESIAHIWQSDHPAAVVSFTRKIPCHSGSGSLSIWTPQVGAGYTLAVYLAEGFIQQPLPVLVSQEFVTLTQVKVGDRIEGAVHNLQVPLIIRGIVRYFPTLYDSPGHGFLIVQRDMLLSYLNRQQRMPVNANELWATTESTLAGNQISKSMPSAVGVLTLGNELSALKADPLTLGLRSVTLLGARLALGLSLVGFITYLYMSIARRETIFAILRSLGLSSAELYGVLAIEQASLVLVGLLLGTLLGLLLNRLVVPGLPLSLGGRPPIPPMISVTDWGAIIRFYLVLAGAFLLVLGSATFFLWRAHLQRLLRIGQE